MKTYTLPCLDTLDWTQAESQTIDQCIWSPNAAPAAAVQGIYLKDRAFVFRIQSFALPDRAENTEPDSSVWEDSCLECFCSFDGENYMNIEVNSKGAFLCCFGPDRNNRRFVRSISTSIPTVKADINDSGWEIIIRIPLELVKGLWGRSLKSGDSFSANFYSCGDKTALPHYAAWNSVKTESPDFHRPEHFGKILIG